MATRTRVYHKKHTATGAFGKITQSRHNDAPEQIETYRPVRAPNVESDFQVHVYIALFVGLIAAVGMSAIWKFTPNAEFGEYARVFIVTFCVATLATLIISFARIGDTINEIESHIIGVKPVAEDDWSSGHDLVTNTPSSRSKARVNKTAMYHDLFEKFIRSIVATKVTTENANKANVGGVKNYIAFKTWLLENHYAEPRGKGWVFTAQNPDEVIADFKAHVTWLE